MVEGKILYNEPGGRTLNPGERKSIIPFIMMNVAMTCSIRNDTIASEPKSSVIRNLKYLLNVFHQNYLQAPSVFENMIFTVCPFGYFSSLN